MKFINIALIILILPYNLFAIDRPEGQPKQFESIVQYDTKIDDPFFKLNNWSYPDFIVKINDDRFEDTETGKILKEKDVPRLRHTANCISSNRSNHLLKYCDARLLSDGYIELYFHELSPAYYDNLLIIIKGNKYTSQYWTQHLIYRKSDSYIWTTKKQNLILDKIKYNANDIIKGKIEFECLEENINPKNKENHTISISGVFKTSIK